MDELIKTVEQAISQKKSSIKHYQDEQSRYKKYEDDNIKEVGILEEQLESLKQKIQ